MNCLLLIVIVPNRICRLSLQKHLPCFCAIVLPVSHADLAIDDDVLNASGVLSCVLIGRVVPHGIGIKNGDIGFKFSGPVQVTKSFSALHLPALAHLLL